MSAIAKVKNKQIDTGKIINILVQAENNAEEILFRIEGEPELVTDFASLAFYLLYTRPGDTVPSIVLLEDASVSDGVIQVPFTPTSYFTANDGTVKIQLLISDIEVNLSVNDDGTIDGSTLWQTFPAFLFVASSQLNATETIIEENVLTKYLSGVTAQALKTEGFAVGEQNGVAVGPDSEYHKNNAKYYKNLAKDWAMKTGGPVEGVEMSAKYYAGTADSRAKEAEGYALGTVSGTPSALFAGKNAKELASDAQDWAKGTRSDGKTPSHTSDSAKAYAESAAASAGIVSDHATAIDAIYADLLNIDVVATDIQDDDSVIDAVAQNIANVNAVAGNESNINAVNSNKTNINTVAGSISNVGTVAGNISNVNAVAGNTANINAVKTNESNINTVAGISSNVTTVAGIASDVTAVAGIASDVSAVEDIKTDVSAVASIDTDVSAVSAIKDDVSAVATIDDDVTTVATDISDVSTVASDITKVTAVADDLTNIDAVADDLTNIDNAVNYALEAEGFAVGEQNGTPVSSGSPYYQNNAKYYSQEVPALKDAITSLQKQIDNITEAEDLLLTVDYKNGETAVPPNVSEYAEVEILKGVGRVANQLSQLGASIKNTITDTRAYLDLQWSRNTSPFTNIFSRSFSQSGGFEAIVTASFTGTTRLIHNGSRNNIDFSNNFVNVQSDHKYLISGNLASNDPTVANGIQIDNLMVTDLTVYFNGNIPSGLDIATIRQSYPELLVPSDYDTEVVFPTYTAVKSVGVNLWDEVVTIGRLDDNGDLETGYSLIASLNYIPVKSSTDYFFKLPYSVGNGIRIAWYDAEKNVISVGNKYSASQTSPNNAYWMRFNCVSEYVGTTYRYDIQICLNSLPDAVKQNYHAHMTDTLALPSPVTLKGAGSVAEEYYPESGRVTHPIGQVDLGTLGWNLMTAGGSTFYASIVATNNNANAICGRYLNIGAQDYTQMQDKTIQVRAAYIYVEDSSYTDAATFMAAMSGVILYYELATPDHDTYVDPLPDNYIKVEPNGTIETVQSQSPKVDGAMTATFTKKVSA